jgi:hypothetical protein
MIPILYETIGKFDFTPQESLLKYSHFVRHITSYENDGFFELIQYPNVEYLEYTQSLFLGNEGFISAIKACNRKLKDLSLSILTFSSNLVTEILRCNHLSTITLSDIKIIDVEDTHQLYKLFSRVKSIVLIHPYYEVFEEIRLPECTENFPSLQHLQYSSCRANGDYYFDSDLYQVIIAIMARAPNITSLNLDLDIPPSGIEEYNNMISTCSFPNIKELFLRDMKGARFIISTLNSTTMVEKIKIVGLVKGNISPSIAANHSESIRYLYLRDALDVSGSMVQDILSGCPHLEEFEAIQIEYSDLIRYELIDDAASDDSLSPDDFVPSKDWICLNLKSLTLYFNMGGGSDEEDEDEDYEDCEVTRTKQNMAQDHAFRQLSRLTMLESLNLSDEHFASIDSETLDIRSQSCGGNLESLVTLRKLKSFRPSMMQHYLIGDKELEWMKLNWGFQPSFEDLW